MPRVLICVVCEASFPARPGRGRPRLTCDADCAAVHRAEMRANWWCFERSRHLAAISKAAWKVSAACLRVEVAIGAATGGAL